MPVEVSDSHHCYLHDVSGNAAWWWDHISKEDHDYTGTISTCKDCNAPEAVSTFKGKLFNRALPPAYCEECTQRRRNER